DFEAATGHDLLLVSGSTGKLYAQIVSGAPFEILLAADQRRPERLVADGRGVAASLRTYAVGRLVLWSPDPKRVASEGEQTLRGASFRRLALANPDLAPYGVAAREVLTALGLEGLLANRLVMGENIGQAYALVATGNAELGLLAASQQMRPGVSPSGSRWLVPADLHGPIRQDVVLLRHASQSVGARAFLDYLSSSQAKHIIRSFGYDVD
ncbi:MAG: molybdate ABC transporter substrate-binding protein, partial [Deltaproteobacteria bacterium]|nr:molybdate ABC transporter substrate-binding protein [Deltaproteobacteria bacterium]